MSRNTSAATANRAKPASFLFEAIVDDICSLNWGELSSNDLTNVAWAYYYFSVQFRENLELARTLYPDDARLTDLDHGERNTDNLSPWPGVAAAGEKMDHDEFMRRTLSLVPTPEELRRSLVSLGESYLADIRSVDNTTRAMSLASYEDGGLEAVFCAILTAKHWDGPLLGAFRHFLSEHIRFDSDPEAGHGALCRHLTPDDRILPLWTAFRRLLVESAPALEASKVR